MVTVIELLIDGKSTGITPSNISWNKKVLAGTTFNFPYPNPYDFARGVFKERIKHITFNHPGMSHPLLEGFVTGISNDTVATIECADPITFLSDEMVSPTFLNTLAGRDAARVLADLLVGLGRGALIIKEHIQGTDPQIVLPTDFIDAPTAMGDLMRQLLDYVDIETIKVNNGMRVSYFVGFVGGYFRFQKLPELEDDVDHFTLNRDVNLYEEDPEFHFDRVVNRARAFGKDADDKVIDGPIFEDEQSIRMIGVREPDDPIEIETDNLFELFIRARQIVEEKKRLIVTKKVDLPDSPGVTPGIQVVNVVLSASGAPGRSRVVQVEGQIGPGGRITTTLESVPLDDLEVLQKIVRTPA